MTPKKRKRRKPRQPRRPRISPKSEAILQRSVVEFGPALRSLARK